MDFVVVEGEGRGVVCFCLVGVWVFLGGGGGLLNKSVVFCG